MDGSCSKFTIRNALPEGEPEWLQEAIAIVKDQSFSHDKYLPENQVPFVNREQTIATQISIFMFNLYMVQAVGSLTRSDAYISIADIMSGSGKTTFGKYFLQTARSSVGAWLNYAQEIEFNFAKLKMENPGLIDKSVLEFFSPTIWHDSITAEDLLSGTREFSKTLLQHELEFDRVVDPHTPAIVHERHRSRHLLIGAMILQQMIAIGKELHSGKFAAWWQRPLYRLLHADMSYISLPTTNHDEVMFQEIYTSISNARKKPHRAVMFHFDDVTSGIYFRQVWASMVEKRIESARLESPSDVLVEFFFTGHETHSKLTGTGSFGSPTPVHWILFHSLQEKDVDEIIQSSSTVENALSHLTNRVESLRRRFIHEIAISCGGIPLLVHFSLGAMAGLVDQMADRLSLSTEEEIRIFVHKVLFGYYAKTAESSTVRIASELTTAPDSTHTEQQRSIKDSNEMLLIIAQVFSRREEIATKRQNESISLTLKRGRTIDLSIAELMVSVPIYFSLGPTQAFSLHVVQSSFVVRAMLINAPDLYIASRIELAASIAPSSGLCQQQSDFENALEIAFATTVHFRLLTSPLISVAIITGLDIRSRHTVIYGNASRLCNILSTFLSHDASVHRFSQKIVHLPRVTTRTSRRGDHHDLDSPQSDASLERLLHYFGEIATLHPTDAREMNCEMLRAVAKENKHIVLMHRPKSSSVDVVAFLSTHRVPIVLMMKLGSQESTITGFAKELKKMQRLHDVRNTSFAAYLFGGTSLNEAFGALIPPGDFLVLGPGTYTIQDSKLACDGKIVNSEHTFTVSMEDFQFKIWRGEVSIVMHPACLRDYLGGLGNISHSISRGIY